MSATKKRPKAEVVDRDLDDGMRGSIVQRRRDAALLRMGYRFDAEAADRACNFFIWFLRHSKGEWAGRPFELMPWQRAPLRRLFGWMRPDGTRRYRKTYWRVPRKNGKSTIAAGIALYLTIGDREPGAEVYGAAVDKEQAKIVFREAANMVKASPELSSMLQVFRSAVVHPDSLSSYQPLSSEGSNKDGLNPHGVIIDELHEWSDMDMWEKLTTAMGARRQPITAIFTTAGHAGSTMWIAEDEYAIKVDAGEVVDDEYLPVLYGAKKGENWHDPEVWKRANPNYGISLKPSYMESQHREAAEKPAYENTFKRYHLNMRTEQATRWMPMDRWDQCGGAVDLAKLAGQRCWVGLDLSRRNDITAAVKVFREEDGRVIVAPRFYIPGEDLDARARRDKVPFPEWVERGFITATPGNVIDYEFIRADLLREAKEFELQEVAYDPYGATQLALQLAADGIRVVEFGQSVKFMSEPTKQLLNLVLQRRLVHGGNPVLRWMAENAAAIKDANDNEKLVKNKSTGRIDGIVATIMALARAMVSADQRPVYEDHEPTVV